MPTESRNGEIEKNIIDVLNKLDLDPKLVQRGSIRELRGGVACIDLSGINNIDSITLLSKISSLWDGAEYRYKIDYALRGGIRGILPGREIAKMKTTLTGILRKSIEDIEWIVPKERERKQERYAKRTQGIPPKPGEIWKNGPHNTLVKLLNNDDELKKKIRSLLKKDDYKEMKLKIFSDGWGESIRLTGGLWMKHTKVINTYISESYLSIASHVFRNIKEIRRQFGGLTF